MKYQSKDLAQFPEQIRYAVSNYKSPGFTINEFDNIILCGLGGSGIAGRIAKSFFSDKCPLPIEVISDYALPRYANNKTLAILCSYSGNTEETLSMYADATAKGARIIVIATGGKLAALAHENNNIFYQAVAGFQPRMALGYSFSYLFLLFNELLGNIETASHSLSAVADLLSNEQKYVAEGENIFREIEPAFPAKIIVITDNFTNPIGLRFCQQIQENAKAEAFLHELPESNHNVIESYYGKLDSIFILLNSDSHPRTSLRFSFIKNLLTASGNTVLEIMVDTKGIAPSLEIIYALDWLSLLLADYKELNSSNIKNIIGLKDFLSNS